MKVSPESIFAWDTETTGFSFRFHSMIQVGVVGPHGESFQSLLQTVPVVPAPITRLTRISTADIARAPLPETALRGLFSFLRKSRCLVLVGFNCTSFDWAFLFRLCAQFGLVPPIVATVDLLPLVRARFGRKLTNNKLGTVHEHLLGVPIKGAHDALADAAATLRVAQALGLSSVLDQAVPLPDRYWAYRRRYDRLATTTTVSPVLGSPDRTKCLLCGSVCASRFFAHACA
jgi:DNA polymerase III epsilon subunit-like protein